MLPKCQLAFGREYLQFGTLRGMAVREGGWSVSSLWRKQLLGVWPIDSRIRTSLRNNSNVFFIWCMFPFNSEFLLSDKLMEPITVSGNEFLKIWSVLNSAVTFFYMSYVRKALTVIAGERKNIQELDFHSTLKSYISPVVPFSFSSPLTTPSILTHNPLWFAIVNFSFIYSKIKAFNCTCGLVVALLNLQVLCFWCIFKH